MYNSQDLTSKRSKVDLRDELAQLHLDDGAVKLDFQELRICLDVLVGLAGVWREDSQHPHVAADHHLVCRLERQERTSCLTNNNLRTFLIHSANLLFHSFTLYVQP